MPPDDRDFEMAVAAVPAAAAEARRAIGAQRLVPSEQEPKLMLLVSELVTNSIRHAGMSDEERIRLRARSDDDCARVEVCDPAHTAETPHRREPHTQELEPGGLGLALVDAMADRWGVVRRPHETCVWFELACVGA
jgi:anti-sigma regulatory factor (Ser/Thr protein kinase)